MFSINRRDFILFISISILFVSQTLGFDLYHHVLSVSDFNSISDLNYDYIVFDNIVPRYLAFHYFVFGFVYLGIPPVIFFIIFNFILSRKLLLHANKSVLLNYILHFLVFLVSFFWAPMSLVIILSTIFYFSRSPIYLYILGIIHPVGLLFSFLFSFIFFKKSNLNALFFIISSIFILINLIPDSTVKCEAVILSDFEILSYDLDFILIKVYSKWKEASILFIVFIYYTFFVNTNSLSKRSIRFNFMSKLSPISILFSFSFVVFFYMASGQIFGDKVGVFTTFNFSSEKRLPAIFVKGWLYPKYGSFDNCTLKIFRDDYSLKY